MSRFWSDIVDKLMPYVPGEQPVVAHPVKLNTNENPYPPSPRVLDAIHRELGNDGDALRKYPDSSSQPLREAIARAKGLRAEQVFVGNGSDEVLAHTFQALLKHDKPIRFPDVSYSFYPVYAKLFGVAYEAIPVNADFAIDVDDYRAPNGGVLLPNPNAPTGRVLPLAEIEILLAANPDSVVVIDEAYVEFGAESAVGLIGQYPNLLVVQTFSKGRSLAGMRVGYAMGDESLIAALTRVKDSFNSYPLDRLAQVAAIAALEDDAWFRESRDKVMASRERLTFALISLGFDVILSEANFVFARHPAHDAAALAASLREKEIFVRHFKQARIDQHLRITVGTDAECDTLIEALKALV